ncbi:MAG: hypothetical protein U0165_10115 [Polyangiaceae bacterium]
MSSVAALSCAAGEASRDSPSSAPATAAPPAASASAAAPSDDLHSDDEKTAKDDGKEQQKVLEEGAMPSSGERKPVSTASAGAPPAGPKGVIAPQADSPKRPEAKGKPAEPPRPMSAPTTVPSGVIAPQ